MATKEDLYKTLEVPETASSDEIKKSYRRLSLKYHPDKNPNDPSAVDAFQKISAAYETLGNQEKREEYDAMKKNPFARMMHEQGGGGGVNMDDIFSNLFFGGMPMGGMHMGGMPGQGSGGIFSHFQQGGMPGNIHFVRHNGIDMRQFQKPQPIIQTVTINMKLVLNGGSVPTVIERWIVENGSKVIENSTIYINIPKGIDDNEIIMIPDQGNVINESIKGDVKIFIKVENDSGFVRNGLDLILHKTISLKEALCGFSFDLKYINDKIYTINNQKGNIISPEYNKVIPNLGLTREPHTGNLIIQFHVDFPTSLTDEKVEALKNILP